MRYHAERGNERNERKNNERKNIKLTQNITPTPYSLFTNQLLNMNELNSIITYFGVASTIMFMITPSLNNNTNAIAQNSINQNQIKSPLLNTNLLNTNNPIISARIQPSKTQPSLKLTITVDDPSHLKVKEGDEIREGQVIAENTIERDRLKKQRQSIVLNIENIKSKPIPKPIPPAATPPLKPLPAESFATEAATIAQAELKLTQAKSVLGSQTQLLTSDNPERRAETEKAEAELRLAQQKVEEQEQLLKSMQDMQLGAPVLRHEEAKLKGLLSEQEQTRSALEQQRARLNASAIEQQQKLQQLRLNVQIAESELSLAKSRLVTAQNQRKLTEYQASLDSAQRIEQQNQSQQNWSKQQQDYAQQLRDRDYQLAQLNLSLSTIDDKLAQIPVVKSPRNGYIRRIKNWTGNNGKYSTEVTISTGFNRRSTTTTSNSPKSFIWAEERRSGGAEGSANSNGTKPFIRSQASAN